MIKDIILLMDHLEREGIISYYKLDNFYNQFFIKFDFFLYGKSYSGEFVIREEYSNIGFYLSVINSIITEKFKNHLGDILNEFI